LCKSYSAFSYTGEYNICWFAISIYFEHYGRSPNAKNISHCTLQSKTIKEWQEFYEKKLNSGEDRKYNHIIYLKDLSFINLRVCEKYNLYVCQMGRYANKRDNPNYYKHIKNCNGKKKEKKLIVNDVELPICPGMMYDNMWMYFKSHDLLHLWKPNIYFGTYDIETVETPYIKNNNKKEGGTQILASFFCISISSTFHIKAACQHISRHPGRV
jgi:hypothetical protein